MPRGQRRTRTVIQHADYRRLEAHHDTKHRDDRDFPPALAALEGVQSASTYRLVEEVEEIAGPSFVAFRRVATLLRVPADPAPGTPAKSCSFAR
jgi:hypothetical protein